jgi:hypothetical protein
VVVLGGFVGVLLVIRPGSHAFHPAILLCVGNATLYAAFNMLTRHGAAGSPTRRRAFSLRLTGDDVRWAPRPHRTSPPFDDVDLPAGSSLEHERFRVLWRA